MKKIFVLLFLSSLVYGSGEFRTPNGIISQGHVSVGTSNPADPSAVVDLQSTTQGVAFPRMTSSQMNAISSPVAGLTIYNITANALFSYQNGVWSPVGSSSLPSGLSGTPPIIYNDAGNFSCAVASGSQAGCIAPADFNRFSAVYSRVANTVSSSFTIPTLTADYILNVDTTGGAAMITLPDAVSSSALFPYCVRIKNIGSPVNLLTIVTQLSQTLDRGIALSSTIPDIMGAKEICPVSGNWWNQ